MKVLTGSQMAELDRQAIERLGIPSLVLMEMAGRAVTEELCTRFPDIAHKKIVVIIGKGNNGGDGLVVARSLIDLGAAVEVHALCAPKEFSEETRHQAEILSKLGVTLEHHTKPHDMRALARALADAELVVDGLFGTGFRGAAKGSPPKLSSSSISARRSSAPLIFPPGWRPTRGTCWGRPSTLT
jgi:hydroxyethylthiazole kinase-like uncharacterized protein yjeF